MAGFQIRRYRDEDEEVVKEIFTLGMIEHVPTFFVHMLKQPLTQLVLMCVFCALLASSKSFLLPVLAITLLLAGMRQLVTYIFNNYIDTSLKEDLRSIPESYMEKRDTCFWVAESEGRVVATVACLPCEMQQGCLELKRMSIQRSHRGLGIGKALCQTVEDFTRERGYQAVVLHTTVVQTAAQKLYECMGYTKIREFLYPKLEGKLTNFTIIEYRLEVQEREGFICKDRMALYHVREYRDEGLIQGLWSTFMQCVCKPWAQLSLVGIFCVLLAPSRSLLGSFLGLTLVLLVPREGVWFFFDQGIQLGLSEYLWDIRKSYMQRHESCFWVAEIQECIVGTVAILPSREEPGSWELKRISVRRAYRTALDFVAARGVENVVLFTSMVPTDAHKLYRSLGFHKGEELIWPSLPEKLINFMVFKYKYRVLCW